MSLSDGSVLLLYGLIITLAFLLTWRESSRKSSKKSAFDDGRLFGITEDNLSLSNIDSLLSKFIQTLVESGLRFSQGLDPLQDSENPDTEENSDVSANGESNR